MKEIVSTVKLCSDGGCCPELSSVVEDGSGCWIRIADDNSPGGGIREVFLTPEQARVLLRQLPSFL